MAKQQVSMGIAMILATIVCAAAQSSTDCTNVLISMSPCLNFISGNATAPSSACCSQLRTVVGSKPECLCQVINGGASNLGISINQTQALALPGACSVQTPSLSRCNAASPAGSPGSTPDADSPNTTSGGGSKTVPRGDGSSDATSNKLGVAVVFGLIIASFIN